MTGTTTHRRSDEQLRSDANLILAGVSAILGMLGVGRFILAVVK
jgi:hypothetical protein